MVAAPCAKVWEALKNTPSDPRWAKFERLTRRREAIHEIAFLGLLVWSVGRAATHRTSKLNLGFAAAVYVVLILSPAMLQRYNRLRVLAVLRRHFSPSATPLQS